MKLFSIITFLLAGTAVALPSFELSRRDATSSNSSIQTVQSDYQTLTSDVKVFNPSAVDVIESYVTIQNEAKTLANDLQTAISTISGSGQFGLFDSISLLIQRLALEPIIVTYVLLMILMKPQFDSILGVLSVRQEILAILQQQSSLQQQMDTDFANALNPLIAIGMQPVELAEQALFQAAITVYEQPAPAGHIEVPAGQVPSASMIPASAPATV